MDKCMWPTGFARACYLLDLPWPTQFALQAMRCITCRKKCIPTREDVRATFPAILVLPGRKAASDAAGVATDAAAGNNGREIYMSRNFLMTLVLDFYERLNSRDTRRMVAEAYMANGKTFHWNLVELVG